MDMASICTLRIDLKNTLYNVHLPYKIYPDFFQASSLKNVFVGILINQKKKSGKHSVKIWVEFTGYPSNHSSGCRSNRQMSNGILTSKNIQICKVERILKGNLDSIPSPSHLMKIQIMGGKFCLKHRGKTLLPINMLICIMLLYISSELN